MNAAVSIRMNGTGMLSPTSAQRKEVSAKLAEDAGIRTGMRLKAMLESASEQAVSRMTAETGETTSTGTDTSSTLGRVVNDELGKEAFLQLLVLQMQHQDPLDPTDNSAMVAQLAQFSALEAMNNLNDAFDTLSGNVDQLNFMSASQLLGRTVEGVDLDGNVRRGVVEGVHLDGSLVVLSVDGGFMSMAGIANIEPTVVATD